MPIDAGLAWHYNAAMPKEAAHLTGLASLAPVLETAMDAVMVIDAAGIVLAWNRVAEQVFGWDEPEAVGRSLAELIIPHQHRDAHANGMERFHRSGEARVLNQRIEITGMRRNGDEFPVELSITTADTPDGPVFMGFLRDISERRRTEEVRAAAFAAAAEKDAILTQLAEGVIVTDAEGRITFVNESASRIHGVVELGIEPDDYSKTYHLFTEAGEPYPADRLPLARAVRGETVENARWRIQRPDRSWVLAIGSARPVLDKAGKQAGALLTLRDDTEREARERQIRESEARLRALTDHLPGGMVYQLSTGRDGSERRFLYVSQSHETLTGIPAEAVLVDSSIPYSLIHPDDQQKLVAAEAASLADNSPFDLQLRFRRTDGEERWCRIVSAPRQQPDGSLVWDGLQLDITDRVLAELELQQLNRTLERRVEQRTQERDRVWTLSEDMFARADYAGKFLAVSPAWTRVLGWTESELMSRSYASFMHPDDMGPTLAALEGMGSSGQPARFENRIATASGSWKWIEWTVAPEPDAPSFVAVGRDLSASKAREEELAAAREALRQSQKMEAMGQLTGGVAHDFNNLLTPIVGSLDLLQRRGVGDEREQRLIAGAMQSADRAKTLVQRLLAFARRQPLKTVPVDVGQLVNGMTELIASTTGPQIKVICDLPEDLRPALADANQLEMALLNLAVNARDAMPDRGVLRVSAAEDCIAAAHRSALPPGSYLRLSISDTGIGMDPETLARATEPFFSTKGIGRGTGLGLSMVHGLAAQLGGAMHIQSHQGLGTNVELWLPISSVAADFAMASEGQAAPQAQAGTALLVDDETLVRMSTAAMLADLGYQVTEASSAEDALALLDQGLQPDLLVSDHLMPGMNGTDLAREVRTRQPSTKVLVISGYAESEGIAPDLPRLTKPFRADELSASLAGLA